MGMLSEFFIAEPRDVAKYDDEDAAFPEADCCRYKHLGVLEVERLCAVLRAIPFESALSDFDVVHQESDEGPWTTKIPDDVTALLAQFQESDVAPLALAWSEATKEELGWDASGFGPIVRDLIRLARAANHSGKSLYFWLCL